MSQNVEIVPAAQLADSIGKVYGPTEWVEITQDMVNQFADLTQDHQFIHVDPEATSKTPLGGTIVHGFFTLSMLSHLCSQTGVAPQGIAMAYNYGFDKVRFLHPVRVGKRIRARIQPKSFSEKRPGEILCCNEVTVEIEGIETPALIAEFLSLVVLGGQR